MDNNGMVTKAEYLKMMEMKWDKMAKGRRNFPSQMLPSVFMDTSRALN